MHYLRYIQSNCNLCIPLAAPLSFPLVSTESNVKQQLWHSAEYHSSTSSYVSIRTWPGVTSLRLSPPKSPVKSKEELHMGQFILLSKQLVISQLKQLRKKDKPILAPKSQFTLDTCVLYSSVNIPSHNNNFFQYWTLEFQGFFFCLFHSMLVYIYFWKHMPMLFLFKASFTFYTDLSLPKAFTKLLLVGYSRKLRYSYNSGLRFTWCRSTLPRSSLHEASRCNHSETWLTDADLKHILETTLSNDIWGCQHKQPNSI